MLRIDETVNKKLFPNQDQMEKNHTHVINHPDRERLMVNRPLVGRYCVIILAYLMIIHYLTCMQSNDNVIYQEMKW
jgi:hypothetical protein